MTTPTNREGDQRHRFWRFTPEITTGNLLTAVTIAAGAIVAYGTYRADQTQTRADIKAVEVRQLADRDDFKSTVSSFRDDTKELKKDVQRISESIAEIKAQNAAAPRPYR